MTIDKNNIELYGYVEFYRNDWFLIAMEKTSFDIILRVKNGEKDIDSLIEESLDDEVQNIITEAMSTITISKKDIIYILNQDMASLKDIDAIKGNISLNLFFQGINIDMNNEPFIAYIQDYLKKSGRKNLINENSPYCGDFNSFIDFLSSLGTDGNGKTPILEATFNNIMDFTQAMGQILGILGAYSSTDDADDESSSDNVMDLGNMIEQIRIIEEMSQEEENNNDNNDEEED